MLKIQFEMDDYQVEISGLKLILNFISSEMEQYLVTKIDTQQWNTSQSGRRKQANKLLKHDNLILVIFLGLWA